MVTVTLRSVPEGGTFAQLRRGRCIVMTAAAARYTDSYMVRLDTGVVAGA